MLMDIPINKAHNGRAGFPRQWLSKRDLADIHNIREAWGELRVPLTPALIASHIEHGIPNVTEANVGYLLERLLKEIDALHEMLEKARDDALMQRFG